MIDHTRVCLWVNCLGFVLAAMPARGELIPPDPSRAWVAQEGMIQNPGSHIGPPTLAAENGVQTVSYSVVTAQFPLAADRSASGALVNPREDGRFIVGFRLGDFGPIGQDFSVHAMSLEDSELASVGLRSDSGFGLSGWNGFGSSGSNSPKSSSQSGHSGSSSRASGSGGNSRSLMAHLLGGGSGYGSGGGGYGSGSNGFGSHGFGSFGSGNSDEYSSWGPLGGGSQNWGHGLWGRGGFGKFFLPWRGFGHHGNGNWHWPHWPHWPPWWWHWHHKPDRPDPPDPPVVPAPASWVLIVTALSWQAVGYGWRRRTRGSKP